jgi:hypothetical protein
MVNPSDLKLEPAADSELTVMVQLLLARVEFLEKEVQYLREENERLKRPKLIRIETRHTEMKALAKNFQTCLQHLLRNLKRIPDRLPESTWTVQMWKLFCEGIHLNKGSGVRVSLQLWST